MLFLTAKRVSVMMSRSFHPLSALAFFRMEVGGLPVNRAPKVPGLQAQRRRLLAGDPEQILNLLLPRAPSVKWRYLSFLTISSLWGLKELIILVGPTPKWLAHGTWSTSFFRFGSPFGSFEELSWVACWSGLSHGVHVWLHAFGPNSLFVASVCGKTRKPETWALLLSLALREPTAYGLLIF